MTRYCEIKGLSADQRDDMLHHFARMDDAFIAHMDEKRPKSGG